MLSDDADNLASASTETNELSQPKRPKFDPNLVKSIRENTDFLQQQWAADREQGGGPHGYRHGVTPICGLVASSESS